MSNPDKRLRSWLYNRRCWVSCDGGCNKVMRPRWLAMRQGWACGGIAGWYDYCPKCRSGK